MVLSLYPVSHLTDPKTQLLGLTFGFGYSDDIHVYGLDIQNVSSFSSTPMPGSLHSLLQALTAVSLHVTL